jgi:hypothetical protein
MLFNSYTFILGFMPLTLLLFHGLRAAGLAQLGQVGVMSERSAGPPEPLVECDQVHTGRAAASKSRQCKGQV